MDVEATDYDSRTALHVAAAEGHLNVIKTLLEQCKVDVNPRDRYRSLNCSASYLMIFMNLNPWRVALPKSEWKQNANTEDVFAT